MIIDYRLLVTSQMMTTVSVHCSRNDDDYNVHPNDEKSGVGVTRANKNSFYISFCADDDDDGDIYIMMKCLCVCLS